jgi:hypothetical protein
MVGVNTSGGCWMYRHISNLSSDFSIKFESHAKIRFSAVEDKKDVEL